MSWEISIVICVLGTAFFLVYLSNSLSGEGMFQQVFKIFLCLTAMTLLLVNMSLPFHILDANDVAAMNETAYNGLIAGSTAQMTVTTWTFYFFIALFILYFVATILQETAILKSRK